MNRSLKLITVNKFGINELITKEGEIIIDYQMFPSYLL